MAVSGAEVLAAADTMLSEFEAADLLNREEMERVRKTLVRDIRADAKRTVEGMQTQRFGRREHLANNVANRQEALQLSQRTRQRLSKFRVTYLNRAQVEQLRNGRGDDIPVGQFVRNSNRLAKATRQYLKRVAELDPNTQEEVDAVLAEMEDNSTDLLGMEVKSFKKIRENVLRSVNGQIERSEALRSATDWDIDKNLWNLSVVEHPKASVRKLMDNAARRFGGQLTTNVTEVPKRSFVFASAPPDAVSRMTPASRTADIQWRVFSLSALSKHYRGLGARASLSTPAGLGLGFNTRENYIPIPPESLEEVEGLLTERRAAFLRDMKAQREATDLEKERKAQDEVDRLKGKREESEESE